MSENLELEFDKADKILSTALEKFQEEKVSQYVWAIALVEVGITALVKLDKNDDNIVESVKQFIRKAK